MALALANVYGPRQDPHGEAGVISIFTSTMLAGETPTIFGDGNQTRDYVFVDDVVHAFALAADRGSGRVVNIGTSRRDLGERALPDARATSPGSRASPSTGPSDRATSAGTRSTPRSRATCSGGGRGPIWRTASARPSAFMKGV